MKKTVNKFSYAPETKINKGIGFTAFQHFNNDVLYSDVVVRPENNYTETENLECFPIPSYVPQNGVGEGYYPESSIAYIRVLWKEFEPKQNEFNYDFISGILEEARKNGKVVMFRLIQHSTREEDDVPDWVKEMIECPKRPKGMRIKDTPTDPKFIDLFCNAIKVLGEKFDKDPTLFAIDISLPGAWGEGDGIALFEKPLIDKIMNTYLENFPNTQIIGQIISPELVLEANKVRPVGWRADGIGGTHIMKTYYPPKMKMLKGVWKNAHVSFESYWWLGEWQRKGWDIDKIMKFSLKEHISSFNPKSLPIPFEWKDKILYWQNKMGFHFGIKKVSYDGEFSSVNTVNVKFFNYGVAPVYESAKVVVRLKGKEEYVFETDFDMVRKCNKNINFSYGFTLPETAEKGEYALEIGIKSYGEMLSLCTDAKQDGGYYVVGKVIYNGK